MGPPVHSHTVPPHYVPTSYPHKAQKLQGGAPLSYVSWFQPPLTSSMYHRPNTFWSNVYQVSYHRAINPIWLVVSNIWIIFHFIYGMSSFPLTNSIIFQDGHIAPPTRYSSYSS